MLQIEQYQLYLSVKTEKRLEMEVVKLRDLFVMMGPGSLQYPVAIVRISWPISNTEVENEALRALCKQMDCIVHFRIDPDMSPVSNACRVSIVSYCFNNSKEDVTLRRRCYSVEMEDDKQFDRGIWRNAYLHSSRQTMLGVS